MSRRIRLVLAVLVFLLVMQIVIFAPQTVNSPQLSTKTLIAPDPIGQDVDQSMKGMHLFETSEGKREWELWSEEAQASRSKSLLELKGVRVVLYAENGVEFTVTGERGQIETETKNLKIKGQVVTQSSNGYQFRTEEVAYTSSVRTLVSPGEVIMVGPKDERGSHLDLRGESLTADLKTSLMTIAKSVRAERDLPPNRHVVIHSQGAQFSGQGKLAKFLGNVVMDMENMRITGPEAEFVYDSKGEAVRSISVKGGVRVSDTEKWATAQNLKVEFEEDRFIFKGSPRVVQGSDELRGEEIVFLDGGRRVLVQRARAKVDEKTMEKVN